MPSHHQFNEWWLTRPKIAARTKDESRQTLQDTGQRPNLSGHVTGPRLRLDLDAFDGTAGAKGCPANSTLVHRIASALNDANTVVPAFLANQHRSSLTRASNPRSPSSHP